MNGKSKNILIVFILLLNINLLYGQSFRIAYNYTFSADSTNIELVDNEIMLLDIGVKKSAFFSYSKLQYDSLIIDKYNKSKNSKDLNFLNIYDKSKISFSVEKEYPSMNIILNTNLGIENYSIKENNKITWDLISETDTYKGFNIKKATTNFGGRTWIAWYTTDISIFDGPYKFHGLPGLIMKIEDSHNNHKFEFMGIEKRDELESYFFNLHKNPRKIISNEAFNSIWKDYKKDPAKSAKFLLLNSGTGFKISWNGKDYNTSEMIRDTEKNELEKINRNNNFLKLSLYK